MQHSANYWQGRGSVRRRSRFLRLACILSRAGKEPPVLLAGLDRQERGSCQFMQSSQESMPCDCEAKPSSGETRGNHPTGGGDGTAGTRLNPLVVPAVGQRRWPRSCIPWTPGSPWQSWPSPMHSPEHPCLCTGSSSQNLLLPSLQQQLGWDVRS